MATTFSITKRVFYSIECGQSKQEIRIVGELFTHSILEQFPRLITS